MTSAAIRLALVLSHRREAQSPTRSEYISLIAFSRVAALLLLLLPWIFRKWPKQVLKKDWGLDWEIEQQTPIKKKVPEIWERQGFSSQKEYDEVMFQRDMEKRGLAEQS